MVRVEDDDEAQPVGSVKQSPPAAASWDNGARLASDSAGELIGHLICGPHLFLPVPHLISRSGNSMRFLDEELPRRLNIVMGDTAVLSPLMEEVYISTPSKGDAGSSNADSASRQPPSSDGTPSTLPELDPEHELCPYASQPVTSSERVAADGNLMKRSKRTERQKKRQEKRAGKKASEKTQALGPFDLPPELLLNILAFLRPSNVLLLTRTCRSLRDFIFEEERILAREIISRQYPVLEKCLRPPVLLSTISDEAARIALLHPERQSSLGIHRKFQHIPPPDPSFVCTCLTCVLRWNSLAMALDFARWQQNLDTGEPIPLIARGTNPKWNADLTEGYDRTLRGALASPLRYARILELHLASTTGSIRRHGQNKGNRRRRFLMTAADEAAGTDAFLERSGPPTVDFPFHRDNFYMLEAYLPNRGWNAEEERWMYMPDWHGRDLEWAVGRWGPALDAGAGGQAA